MIGEKKQLMQAVVLTQMDYEELLTGWNNQV